MELLPEFILMQQELVRVVLVLDVSGSMRVSTGEGGTDLERVFTDVWP